MREGEMGVDIPFEKGDILVVNDDVRWDFGDYMGTDYEDLAPIPQPGTRVKVECVEAYDRKKGFQTYTEDLVYFFFTDGKGRRQYSCLNACYFDFIERPGCFNDPYHYAMNLWEYAYWEMQR